MAARIFGSIDAQGRCRHWSSPLDIVAIEFFCCGGLYACYDCHEELAGHPGVPWPAGSGAERAVVCGACGAALTIDRYRGAAACPECSAPFNPGCALHYRLYFA